MGRALPEDNTISDTELVRRAQAGEVTAFDALDRRYRAALFAIAFIRTGDRDEADDLAQEALAWAWREVYRLRDPAAFGGWLRRIAINACRDWYRRGRPWPNSLDDPACETTAIDPNPRPLEVLLERERQRELRAALATLPVENQRALLLHEWAGWPYARIAAFLDIPVTTVEGRIHRAKAQLRRVLSPNAANIYTPST
jgi:RNA polymerase sigma-70 factor, ECF subfamily